MTLIKFKRPYEAYNSGEQAGFSEEIAARLVDAGYADEVTKAGKKTTSPSPNPVETT